MAKEENLVINEVNAEDFDDFLGLVDKLAEYEKLTPPTQEAKKRLRNDCLSDKPKFEAFVGKIGNKPVAYVIYFFSYSSFLALPSLFIEDIFVLAEYRRQGIGQRMFNQCKELAKQHGCGRVEFIVLNWNKSAKKFYEKNKAEQLDWAFYSLRRENFNCESDSSRPLQQKRKHVRFSPQN